MENLSETASVTNTQKSSGNASNRPLLAAGQDICGYGEMAMALLSDRHAPPGKRDGPGGGCGQRAVAVGACPYIHVAVSRRP
jgi:hypothetical protein